MSRPDDEKKITQNQINGERGANLTAAAANAMGFLFTPTGGTEGGIDGYLELRNADTDVVRGETIAVQVKTTMKPRLTAETDDGFEYLMEPKDVRYWQQSNLPTILVVVRLHDGGIYWRPVPRTGDPTDLDVRRQIFLKARDVFGGNAADALRAMTEPDRIPGGHIPAVRSSETIIPNLMKVVLPEQVYIAEAKCNSLREAYGLLNAETDTVPDDWTLRSRRLTTFRNPEGTVLEAIIEDGTIEAIETSRFSDTDDRREMNDFAELLKRTLREDMKPLVDWCRFDKIMYFLPQEPAIGRQIEYMSLKRRTKRKVVTIKRRRQDGRPVYTRHSAFRPRFEREFGDWYLVVEPTYKFTRDGYRRDSFAPEHMSKLKRMETNASVSGQFVMWRSLLIHGIGEDEDRQQADMLFAPTREHILGFETLPDMNVPYSVPDEFWRSRDDSPPGTDEELPL